MKTKNLFLIFFNMTILFLSLTHSAWSMNPFGVNRLINAIDEVNVFAVYQLLMQGESPNGVTSHGDPALHVAIKWRTMDIIDLLLRYGADSNGKNISGLTPLEHAKKINNPVVLKILNLYCSGEKRPLSPEEFYFVYEKSALHELIVKNDINAAEQLLKAGISPNQPFLKYSPLQHATNDNKIDMVKLLLKYKANINQVNNYGMNAFHFAAKEGAIRCAKILIDWGIDASQADYYGNMPLHYAIKTGKKDFVQFLLQLPATINMPLKNQLHQKNYDGKTALDIAQDCADRTFEKTSPKEWVNLIHIIELLLDHGARYNVTRQY